MGLGLGLGLGIGRRLKGAGQYLLDAFSGAAAAYSLRKLSVNTTNVIRVRRDADNGERDFTAQEIEDGTLENWVNGIVEDLPLDTESSAAAAYSLRNLSSTYSGAVVKVRRSSDNAEADFTANDLLDGTLTSFVGGQNLCLQSEDINTTWTPNANATTSQSTETTPDGDSTNKYIKLVDNGNGGTSDVSVHQTITVSAGIKYTASVFLKGDQLSFARLEAFGIDTGVDGSQYFGLSGAGSLGTSTNLDDSSITAYPNGWYRCSITWTQGATDTSFRFYIQVANSISNFQVPLDGTSSIFVWGAQVNEGATAGDYAPTTSNIAGNGFVTTWYDQSGNTGRDATQATASRQPKIVDAGVLVEENGKPAVSFDGLNDSLNSPITSVINSIIDVFTNGSEYNTTNSGEDIFGVSNNYGFRIVANSATGLLTNEVLTILHPNSSGNRTAYGGSGVTIPSSQYIFGYYASTVWDIYIDGNKVDNLTSGGFNNTAFQGDFGILGGGKRQELIIYPSDQSSNRGNIEGNINTYYNIYTPIVSDGLVTTWYDQSGNGNDATQSTAASQPKIVSAGVLVTENGKPAVDFDGVDDRMITSFTPTESSAHYFSVVRTPSSGARRYWLSAGLDHIAGDFDGAGRYTHGYGSSVGQFLLFDDSSIQDSLKLFTILLQDSSTSNVYVDGGLKVSGSISGIYDGTLNIGSRGFTDFYNNTIQEIIIFNFDQSGNRTAIEGNINKNYQVYWDGAGYSLLDNFAGAEAAYALVPLSSTYRGAIVKVRRSSDNAERDIYANYDGTLDTSSLLDFCSGTDGYVSVWYDQSGNGNNAVQSTAASQPQIVSGGSLITSNGYTVIQYDGTDDNLGTSFTATGTMLMGGADGGAFYEVAISGAYNLLANASTTDHPLNETLRIIWGRTLSAGEQSAIESRVTYSDWDFSDVTNFSKYWNRRSELTSFPLIDSSIGTNFASAWLLCEGLTSFPALDVSNGTIFQNAWFSCSSLTSFPLLDLSSGTNFDAAWYNCSSLTSFPLLDVSSGTDFRLAWRTCNSLTSFPLLDVSSGTNFSYAWFGCTSLTSFPLLDVSSGTNFSNSWNSCTSLTSFPALNLSSGTNFSVAWGGCTSLQDFPANMFDNVTATNFTNAFIITNLTQTSIDNILVSLDTAGQSGGTFGQSGGSAPSATGEAAIDSLVAKGWTITVTGGYSGKLLDAYSGAAAAYSLRDLTYSGSSNPVVRVRRDSDNAELDFTATQVSDGTLETWVGAGVDGLVVTWYDQSGNGNDATQGSASAQPKIVSAGVLVTENGKPALDFDGGDTSDLTNFITPSIVSTYSVAGVARPDANDDGILILSDGAENLTWHYGRTAGELSVGTYDGATVSYASGSATISNQFLGFSTHNFDTPQSTLFINGSSTSGTDVGRGDTQSRIGGGAAGRNLLGVLQEIILWASDQSSNRTGIEANINRYYNIYP